MVKNKFPILILWQSWQISWYRKYIEKQNKYKSNHSQHIGTEWETNYATLLVGQHYTRNQEIEGKKPQPQQRWQHFITNHKKDLCMNIKNNKKWLILFM